MRRSLFFYLSYWFYWLGLFTLGKIAFLLVYHQDGALLSSLDWLKIIYHGWIMDIATAAYLLLLPTLMIILRAVFPTKGWDPLIKFYTYLVVIIIGLVTTVDLCLYGYWGYRLDLTPFFYLRTPSAVLDSIELPMVFLPGIIGLTLVVGFIAVFKKWLYPLWMRASAKKLSSAGLFAMILLLSFIPMRGGLNLAPLNPGRVYFHKVDFANQAAINLLWNCGYSVQRKNRTLQPYNFIPRQYVDSCFNSLRTPLTKPDKLLTKKQPNIVLIILESWTAQAVEALGGEPGITPAFNHWVEQGLLFTNFYANGDRTDKALAAIFSGWIPLPGHSPLKNITKFARYPALWRDLKAAGYQTAFYYGGDINFVNMKGYLLSMQIDRLITQKDFPKSTYGAKWGVHDEYMFQRFATDLEKAPQPFAYALLTLSSHEPYDVPEPPHFGTQTRAQRLMNAIYYSDKHLGAFLERMYQSELWSETLFILLADHGVRYFSSQPYYLPEKFHIPMLWLGGVLREKGTQITAYCSQSDLPVTLLHQLDYRAEQYRSSRDMLTALLPFAFYTFNNGGAFLSQDWCQIWSNSAQRYLISETNHLAFPTDICRIYLQALSQEYWQP